MKIGILIDHISSLYCWQWINHSDHEYIIYRDQIHQHSADIGLWHHYQIMKQWIDYLISQQVDHIICPPVIEWYFWSTYPQISTIFRDYITHTLQYSIVGKIWFIGNQTQCQSINLLWSDINIQHIPTAHQTHNRHYHSDLPIWTSITPHLHHWLADHNPKHYICNHIIKQCIRPLKDAAVDTIVWLDWSYYACDVAISHQCNHIRWHKSNILRTIWDMYDFTPSTYAVSIHHNGNITSIQQNKKIRRMLTRWTNNDVHEITR